MHKIVSIATPILIFLAGCDDPTSSQRSNSPASTATNPANDRTRATFSAQKPLGPSAIPKDFVGDEPVVAVRAPVSREIKLDGARVILLRAGYETVFTGDVDPKKAVVRLLHYAILIEPLGKHPQGPALSVGPIEAFAAGTDATVKTGPDSGSYGKGAAVKEYYGRTGWIGLPEVENELESIVEERWIGPVVAEPERIDLWLKARNRGTGGACVFKDIRLK